MDNLEAQFRQWQNTPPPDVIGDPIWRMTAYRISLFMAGLVRLDARRLVDHGAPNHKVTQLESSVESVEANLSEGYSKFSGKDRARFFEMALGFSTGSARLVPPKQSVVRHRRSRRTSNAVDPSHQDSYGRDPARAGRRLGAPHQRAQKPCRDTPSSGASRSSSRTGSK